MVFLLELKEGFKKFYNKYDTYLVPAVRFVMALVSFLMLNASIGYMSKLKNPLIAVAMAVLCAFLPNGFMIFFLSVFMLVHLYAISAEFALIVQTVPYRAFCLRQSSLYQLNMFLTNPSQERCY